MSDIIVQALSHDWDTVIVVVEIFYKWVSRNYPKCKFLSPKPMKIPSATGMEQSIMLMNWRLVVCHPRVQVVKFVENFGGHLTNVVMSNTINHKCFFRLGCFPEFVPSLMPSSHSSGEVFNSSILDHWILQNLIKMWDIDPASSVYALLLHTMLHLEIF